MFEHTASDGLHVAPPIRSHAQGEISIQLTTGDPAANRRSAELRVTGSLDLNTAHTLADVATTALLAADHLDVDASGLAFVDASGLRALAEVADMAAQRGATFSLSGRSDALERVLELVGDDLPWADEPLRSRAYTRGGST